MTAAKPQAAVSSPARDNAASARPRNLLLCLLLVAATAVPYLAVHSHPFSNYDDNLYYRDNLNIEDGLTADTIHWSFTTFYAANWHPLTWMSHALDYQIFGHGAAGPHDMNLALHLINVLLLFGVLRRATGSGWRSFMVAALFGMHPVNVESVAWIAERKTVLSMLFFLRRWARIGGTREAAKRKLRYLVVAALFACGLMAKPQVITLPFVLLLWDYWPLRRFPDASSSEPASRQFSYRLVEEKFPLFAIVLASAWITMKAQRASNAFLSLTIYPLPVRLENVIVAYVRYVGKALWPSGLALMYPHPLTTFALWKVALALLFLVAVTWLVLRRDRPRYLPVGWLWFVGTMVPMIGLVQVGSQAMADRYAYLPFVGLFVMIVWGVADVCEQRHLPKLLPAAASAVVLLALMAATYIQVGYWRDNVTLWSHTLAVTRDNFVAEDDLAGALLDAGRPADADVHYRAAAAIRPNDALSHLNIGIYQHKQGNLQAAIEEYKQVLAVTSQRDWRQTALTNMARAYRGLGDSGAAQKYFAEAAKLSARQP